MPNQDQFHPAQALMLAQRLSPDNENLASEIALLRQEIKQLRATLFPAPSTVLTGPSALANYDFENSLLVVANSEVSDTASLHELLRWMKQMNLYDFEIEPVWGATARRPDCSYYASIAQTVADKKLSRVLVTDEAWLMPGVELMFPQHAD